MAVAAAATVTGSVLTVSLADAAVPSSVFNFFSAGSLAASVDSSKLRLRLAAVASVSVVEGAAAVAAAASDRALPQYISDRGCGFGAG